MFFNLSGFSIYCVVDKFDAVLFMWGVVRRGVTRENFILKLVRMLMSVA